MDGGGAGNPGNAPKNTIKRTTDNRCQTEADLGTEGLGQHAREEH